MKFKNFLLLIIFITLPFYSFSAITVNINSGNPTMPFPQFNNYPAGGQGTIYSLADWAHLPDGVSHAEMEKWIRDAYQIMMNRANYAGGTICGVQGIRFESSPLCTEGHGYALLAAALMGDKTTFDGLWFYLNDNCWFNNVPRYRDGTICSSGYKYGIHAPGWNGPGADSATDGDVDIALAALIAWKQWGDNTGYTRWDGQPIRYKDMALDMMRFLVEKAEGDVTGDGRYTSGDIGFDGYSKGGNTWNEVTNWASGQPGDKPQFGGPQETWYDYSAPYYFRCFAETLQANGDPRDSGWNINQFQRAAAAMNWVQGQLAASSYLTTFAGKYSINGTTVSFTNANPGGEDFRAPWRHALDYLWYGNPSTSWNPTTHQIVSGTNTYEHDAAIKLANFLNDPQAYGTYGCKSYGSSPITYRGSPSITEFNLDGTPYWSFHQIKTFGASAAAVVASQNFDLMGQWFRESMIEWDVENAGDGYLTSVPAYFHGFFRVLALLVLTGNYISPCNWNPQANMKIYKSVNKTYTFPGETLTYWLNYRNFGSVTANNVYIRDTLPAAFEFVSSTPNYSSNPGPNIYEWGPFTVSGLQNQNYGATMGGVTLVVRVRSNAAQGKYCNTADIRTSNGTGWTSSDEANEITSILKTNCVDIVAAALTITKTASVSLVNPGQTITYTIDFCNSSQAGWIEGGHSGVIFAGGVNGLPGTSSSQLILDIAGHHEAAEPVIDWNNYRISYFLNSNYHGANWQLYTNSISPNGHTLYLSTEDYVACSPTACYDPVSGKYYNQRIMIRPAPLPSAPTHHLYNYYGNMGRIHLGTATAPLYFEVRITANYNNQDWTDDWSQQTAATVVGGPSQMMFPISPDWTDGLPSTPGVVLNKVNKHACETTSTRIENILIEEWDGYTWRRVFGNGPMPGREVTGVVVYDSLPANLSWGGFITTYGTCTYNTGTRTIQCNIGNMQINQCGQIKYYAIAQDPGCPTSDINLRNIAWIKGDKEAPVSDDAQVTLRCPGGSPTNTPTSTITNTPTSTRTNTPTNTYTLTNTNTPTSTITNTRTNTFTNSPTNTQTPTGTPSPTWTFTNTPTNSFTHTPTNTFTNTFTHTITNTPTNSFTSTLTNTPTSTNTITSTYTATNTRTNTPTVSPTFTHTTTGTPPPTWTFTDTPTNSFTHTSTNTFTSTFTNTITNTSTNSFTSTLTNTPTSTNTITSTYTATNTRTNTPTVSPTFTHTTTGTPPPTWTFTNTPTFTNSFTSTYTFTSTNTPTSSFTYTNSSTPTNSFTPTFTLTSTFTFTSSSTHTVTFTRTSTFTITNTFTHTHTPTITPTPRPSPVDLFISITASGDEPKLGATINYSVTIKNTSSSPVSNISVWDTLPDEVIFKSSSASVNPQLNNNFVQWDFGTSFTLDPGKMLTIEFSVEITNIVVERLPITNRVSVDYNDPYYTPAIGKHPPITSDLSFYPIGEPVVYPNPFNPETARDKKLKFENIVPGSIIQIYTISGETVETIYVQNIICYWDGKNRYGKKVSPGIYFFTITNKETGKIKKGRIFVLNY